MLMQLARVVGAAWRNGVCGSNEHNPLYAPAENCFFGTNSFFGTKYRSSLAPSHRGHIKCLPLIACPVCLAVYTHLALLRLSPPTICIGVDLRK